MDRTQLYSELTAKVVEQIEAGAGEWRMPWAAIAEVGRPVNAVTHAAYRGGNHVVFALVAEARGWSGHWATYKQWASLDAQVRRGEKATYGVHWSTVAKRTTTDDGHELVGEARLVPHVFAVFNSCQVDGWEAPAECPRDTPERLEGAEAFFASVCADVRCGGQHGGLQPGW
jgi:antirestriction protein ArdC